MNQITVMAIVAMMASLWGNSNAGIKISTILEYLIDFENQYNVDTFYAIYMIYMIYLNRLYMGIFK